MDLWIRNISLQALDKVKVEYEIVNGKLAIITPDRYEEAYDILANDFIPYEPLSQAFGLTNWDERFKKMVLEDLRKNLSVCMTCVTFRDCRVLIFPTTFLEIAVCLELASASNQHQIDEGLFKENTGRGFPVQFRLFLPHHQIRQPST